MGACREGDARRIHLLHTRVNKGLIRSPSGNFECCVRETHGPPKLPEGYRLDVSGDPDAPALRRPDGTVVARFGPRGVTHEALEQEARKFLLHTSRKPGGGNPSSSRGFVGHDPPNGPSWNAAHGDLRDRPLPRTPVNRLACGYTVDPAKVRGRK
jgi:hypothetical protein